MGDANKSKLDSIQAHALRVVCGEAWGTATAARAGKNLGFLKKIFLGF